jgi:hypothetical protein
MAAVAAVPNPLLAEFKNALLNVIQLNRGQVNLLSNEGVTIASDLLGVDEESLLAVFPKAANSANRLTIMVKMRLRAFREWAIYRTQELSGTDEDLDPSDFTEDVCGKFQVEIALRDKPGKESSGKSSISGVTLGTFSGKATDWQNAKR